MDVTIHVQDATPIKPMSYIAYTSNDYNEYLLTYFTN